MSRPSTRASAPKHRAAKRQSPRVRRTRGPGAHAAVRPHHPEGPLRRTAVLPGIATAALVAAFAVPALSGADHAGGDTSTDAAAALMGTGDAATPLSGDQSADRSLLAEMTAERGESLSRSDRRPTVVRPKRVVLEKKPQREPDGRAARAEAVPSGDPREIARAMLPQFGFSADQFTCLDSLWTKESGWDVYADNPTSSAYGIPQALPGEKMASAGADWATNPATQIRWGLGYIADSYGTPCSAWSHSVANNWY